MIDHIGIDVSNMEAAKAFYTAALAPLQIGIIVEVTAEQTGSRGYVGMGAEGRPFFWFGPGMGPISPVHIAFRAQSRAQVDAFYAAALANGGQDNGPPGLRPSYHEHYYGAFVLDPDSHNIEAVCHAPSDARPRLS